MMITQADAETFAKEMAPVFHQIVDEAIQLIERDGLKPLMERIATLEALVAELQKDAGR